LAIDDFYPAQEGGATKRIPEFMKFKVLTRDKLQAAVSNRRPPFAAFVVLLMGLASSPVSSAAQDRSEGTTGVVKLTAVFEGERPTEGRLAGGFAYGVYEPSKEGSPPALDTEFYRVARVASDVLEAAAETPSSENLHAAGLLHLIWRQPGDAVSNLEEARARAPGSAAILNDLSMAYFARARRDNRPYDFINALETVDQAVLADGALVEARFNRALVLETVHLPSEARLAWRRYLDLDSDSGWAKEARTHLQQLEVPSRYQQWPSEREALLAAVEAGKPATVDAIVARFPQEVRFFAEGLFFEWAAARGKEDGAEAGRLLDSIREIGGALARFNGDLLILDSLRTIEDSLSKGVAETVSSLADGHRAYEEGRSLYADFRSVEAVSRLEQAEKSLSDGGSPFRAWARLYLAMCLNQQARYAEALDRLEPLLSMDEDRYPNLLGRVHWIEGFAFLSRAHPTASLRAFHSALNLFQKTGEEKNASWVSVMVAQNLNFLGDFTEAWRHQYLALRGVREAGDPFAAYSVYTTAAESLARTSLAPVPIYFEDEALQLAVSTDQPAIISEAFYRRSTMHYRSGDPERARNDLHDAKRFVERIADPGEQKALAARIGIAEAEQVSATDPEEAISTLTGSLQLYQDTDFAYLLIDVLLQRARAFLSMGDKDRAEIDLKTALEESDRQRERVLDPALRVSYFDTIQNLIREMVLFQIRERGRPDLALDYLEQGRARLLLDALGTAPFTLGEGMRPFLDRSLKPLSTDELKRRLPGNVAAIEYMVAEEQLLIWMLRSNSLDFVSTPSKADELQRLTERYLDLVADNESTPELTSVSSELYKRLLGPVLPRVPSGSTLIFSPDRFLNEIPFAALIDPEDGRYLVRDRVVGMAPSATHYVESARLDSELAGRTSLNALVVASPRFDRVLFPRLSDLPSAEASADTIAGLYADSELLTKEKATKSRFLETAGSHSIVHFGGHTLINGDFPMLSRLIFAPEEGSDSGVLYAYELYQQRFLKTRLVILASCSSARRLSSSEGSTGSLAAAFLAAGVPAVLASLWDVEDATTEAFSSSFHKRFRESGDAWRALRDSQLAFIDSGEESLSYPSSWAPFVLIGGGFSRDLVGILQNGPSRSED
jgi:CHAT domain-containing protein